VRTTSRPPSRSTRSSGNFAKGSPLKSVSISVTLVGAGNGDLKRLAAEKGLTVEERGGDLTLLIKAATPEEALAKLGLLTGLLAQKGSEAFI